MTHMLLALSESYALSLKLFQGCTNMCGKHSLLVDAGATDWTAAVLQEFQEGAWFTFGNSKHVASVRGGTRPGDNLADMLFTFLFAEVSKKICSRLRDAGIQLQLPWDGSWLCADPDSKTASHQVASALDVTWMDDLAVLLSSHSPTQLVEDLRAAATCTVEECVHALLLPNLGPGKTEAVATLVGAGSKRAKLETFRGAAPSLALPTDLWRGACRLLQAPWRCYQRHRGPSG